MKEYLLINYTLTALLWLCGIYYLIDNCVDHCNRLEHKWHKLVVLLLLLSPLWGWLTGIVMLIGVIVFVSCLGALFIAAPIAIIHEVLKKNTD
jgi:uncharacterized membrane protein HdeD (DUF308 family)